MSGIWHRYFDPRSLTNRLLLFQVAWAVFIYLLVITALWFATNLVIENDMRHRGEDWVAKLEELGMPIYTSNKPARLKQALDMLRNFPEIAQARYLDESGKKLVAEYKRKGVQVEEFAPLSDEAIQKLKQTDAEKKSLLFETGNNSQMHISAPIWIKSIARDGMLNYSLDQKSGEKVEVIGVVEMVLDYSTVTADLNRSIVNASMIIAVVMLVVAFLMRLMVRRALRPLAELEEPLTRLANGEIDVTVNTAGDEEIVRIGKALNTTINALKERDAALHRMADHDVLTGLLNRARFVERLEQEAQRVARGGTSAALYFFDLDRFKHINDTYGHSAGDRLLIQVTRQLSQRVRKNDVFARYGGDEFVLLAYDLNPAYAHEIAESFIELMRDFVFYEAGESIKIYFSIGVTLIDGDLSAEEYLNEADTAVHLAKTQGRNCYRMFKRGNEEAAEGNDTGMHERLLEVLNSQQLILYYQTLAGLGQEHEEIHEVLLRLPDKTRGVVGPGAFMSAAERFGLMPQFDRQVIGKAVRTLALPEHRHVVLSLNLSEAFLLEEGAVAFLDETMAVHKAEPGRMIFELSYAYVVRNVDKLQPVMQQLVRRGYRFAIDDFGADLGSFNYLRNLPVSFLKLDGSLSERLVADSVAKVAVRAVVEAARALQMQVIAKNVADAECLAELRKLGVGYAQGNHIAAPAPHLPTGGGRQLRVVKGAGT